MLSGYPDFSSLGVEIAMGLFLKCLQGAWYLHESDSSRSALELYAFCTYV